jgi:ribonuclease E
LSTLAFRLRRRLGSTLWEKAVSQPTSLAAASPFTGDELSRAESFAREAFVLEGEDPGTALAEGTARRMALDDALREIDAGRDEPSIEWRQNYSLLLGLERLLSEEDPHLADGATLTGHQVDALSGTLIAITSEVQASRNGRNGARANGQEVEELPSAEVEIEGDEDLADEEPLDWDEVEEAEEEKAADGLAEDPGAARRFWFEHATGSGKTVAAMGFVEASRTGGVLILGATSSSSSTASSSTAATRSASARRCSGRARSGRPPDP